MIRNIVFDMGKVLLEFEPWLPCLRYAGNREDARKLKKAIFDDPAWCPSLDGGVMTEEAYFASACERLDSEVLREKAVEMAKDFWLDCYYPKAYMDGIIHSLLEKGYKVYVLSNCSRLFHRFSYMIPEFDRFSGALVSAEEGLMKPDPRIFLRLCERYGLKPEECLFVDDLARNVEGAMSVGMAGYCFADGDAARLTAFLQSLEENA